MKINWWKKGIFDDLKPFDIYPLENYLERYQKALMSFPYYEDQAKAGFFFLGISSKDTSDPDIKYFHEKFNHPSCDLTEPHRKKICLIHKEGRNFNKPEYHSQENIKFKGNTTNYNGRDGQIRGGWATPNLEEYHINPVRNGVLTGNWIYLHIPYQLLYNYNEISANGAPFDISKKFVKEIESTIGWEDIEKVRKVVDRYDIQYPDWSHDFPINGYFQMKKDGLLFPSVWWKYDMLAGHSYHRMTMTSYNKIDFPYILPVPNIISDKWYANSRKATFRFNNQLHYLTAEIDVKSKLVTYSFTLDSDWAQKKNYKLIKGLDE